MKGEVLTPMEASFCEYFARADSETYGQKKKSALAAGYAESSAGEIATRLTNKKQIAMDRIEQITTNQVKRSIPRQLSNLENHRLLALGWKKPDAANTATKLICQILGLLPSDASATVTREQEKLTSTQIEEAKAYARWRLTQDLEKGEQELGAEILDESTENTNEL